MTSEILDNIDFIDMVNYKVEWGAKQYKVSPSDAVKEMVMMMGIYRLAIENMAGGFSRQP